MSINEKLRVNRIDISDQLVILKDYDSLVAESIRALRTNIILRDFDKKIKVINITSVMKSEGKSTILANLAATFTQLNKRVLLVDCDLRVPSIHKILGIRNGSGLVDVVSNFKLYEECVVHYTKNFDVLTAGTSIPFASEFIQSTALQNFIELYREKYDYIFLDCPPIGIVSDALIISKYTDGTLFAIAVGENERKALKQAKEQLEELHINVLGIVLNKMDINKQHYGYDYGSYRDE